MNRDRDPTRIVRSWLEVGATALPDRVLDAVLDELPTTHQRRPWLAQRLVGTRAARTFALAAAVAIAVTLLGFNYLLAPNVGGPPLPEQTPTPTAAALPPDGGPLDAGTYRLGDALPVPVAFDVPDGLRACPFDGEPAVCGSSIAGLSFGTITNVVVDPCDPAQLLRDPPIGPTVDDLVTALGQLPGFGVHSVRRVVVDGYDGTELEITAPTAGCQLSTWASPYRVNGVAPRETNRMRIIDVDGTRVVLALAYHPTTPPEDLAALQHAMDSVRFEDH